MTQKEAGGNIHRLVVLKQKKEEEEEEFASCSYWDDDSIIIWRRGKGQNEFKRKQKKTNVNVDRLLYISFITNKLISGSDSSSPYLLQI